MIGSFTTVLCDLLSSVPQLFHATVSHDSCDQILNPKLQGGRIFPMYHFVVAMWHHVFDQQNTQYNNRCARSFPYLRQGNGL